MSAQNVICDKFADLDAQVVGISVDSLSSHLAVQEKETGELRYPMCSDFYPHGEVAMKYGVFREGEPLPGISERAIFIVDKQGTIVFSKTYHLGELPDDEECLEVLRKLSTQPSI